MRLLDNSKYDRNKVSKSKNIEKNPGQSLERLQIVKDALKYIIKEDYEENKHITDFKDVKRNPKAIYESSVKMRNL